MLETLAKLVNADKIRIDFTEYELSSEFTEAMEHALESGDSDSEDMEGGGGTSDHEHPDEPFEQPSPSKAPITSS